MGTSFHKMAPDSMGARPPSMRKDWFSQYRDSHHMQPAPSLKGAVDVLEQLAAAFAAPQRVKAQCR